jgi:sec-independent protein translocase protein TatA
MMGISPTQLLIILVIVALVFGTKKLRNMGGDLGGAVRGFKKAMNDDEKLKRTTDAGVDAMFVDHDNESVTASQKESV